MELALLYRLAVWLSSDSFDLHEEQKDLLKRLCSIMEWPVAQLMTLSLAIATDFDSVYRAWKKYHDERGRDLFEGMKQVAETGKGPAEQIPSMGCSIKWKDETA